MRSILTLLCLAVLFGSGCDAFDFVPKVEPQTADLDLGNLFGDAYQLVLDEATIQAIEAEQPKLAGTDLHAWVSFSGCHEPTFTLRYTQETRRSLLVIYYDAPDTGDHCDRLNFQEVVLEVPVDVAAKPEILLLNPNPGTNPVDDAVRLRP